MTFLDLIEIVRDKEATLELAEREAPFAERYGTVLVYIKNEMAVGSELKFVDAEAEIRGNFAEKTIGGRY